MSLKLAIAALAATAQLSTAYQKPAAPAEGMRLIKTSEEDPGKWVTKEEKYKLTKSKNGCTHYIDITNIKDEQVLDALSTKTGNKVNAVDYPTELSHVEEANKLIDTANTDGPQTWLEHLAS